MVMRYKVECEIAASDNLECKSNKCMSNLCSGTQAISELKVHFVTCTYILLSDCCMYIHTCVSVLKDDVGL